MAVAAPDATLPAILKRNWDRPTIEDSVDALSNVPLFASVSRRRLRKVAALAEIRTFEPNSVVVQTGDVSDGLYVILGGRARVLGRLRRHPLLAGAYFGEMGLIDGKPRSATVVSMGELQTMRIPRAPFLRLLEQEPKIAAELLTELTSRIREREMPSVA
jgi:CRP/FNR family transcriptional regulator, cyclic AMP receptor protein